MSILVIDVGTSGVRAAVVRPDATVAAEHHRALLPSTPAPGLVEFDAAEHGRRRARRGPRAAGRGRPRRRRRHRQPAGLHDRVGPRHRRARRPRASAGRTCAPSATASCSRPTGIRLAPNASATKVAYLLDLADPDRDPRPVLRHRRHLDRLAPLRGRAPRHRRHQRRRHRAAARGDADRLGRQGRSTALRIPRSMLPDRRRLHRRDRPGHRARRRAADRRARRRPAGAASSARAACAPGMAKITFGTGGMLDLFLGDRPARASSARATAGPSRSCAWRRDGEVTLGRRGDHARRPAPTSSGSATTSASSPTAAETHDVAGPLRDHRRRRLRARPARPRHARTGTTAPAARCSASPAAAGARRSCGPCSRASPSAAPTWSRPPRPTAGSTIPTLRVDGGMSANPTFVQALADATQRPVEVSPVRRPRRSAPPSSPGWPSAPGPAGTTSPPPGAPARWSSPVGTFDRDRWRDRRRPCGAWFPELSASTSETRLGKKFCRQVIP